MAMLVVATGWIAFEAGAARMAFSLEQAEADRLRLLDARTGPGQAPDTLHRIQADVLSRRIGVYADEVELGSVRAIDGSSRAPRRLLLSLPRNQQPTPSDRPTRADLAIWPGARVWLAVRIAPVRGRRNPGSVDNTRRAARRGHAARARLVAQDWVVEIERPGWLGRRPGKALTAARARARRRLSERLVDSDSGAGLVRALGVGDRTGLPIETRDTFARLGLGHLLAVSGLHVGFVAGLAGALWHRGQRALGGRSGNALVSFDLALAFACVAALAYAMWTDAGVSVERAGALFVIVAAARLCRRRIDPMVGLAIVAGALFYVDPAAVFDAGPQLSFGACVALMGVGLGTAGSGRPEVPRGRGVDRVERLGGVLRQGYRVSLAAALGTAPILAAHGWPLALPSPVLNLAAVPWTGFVALPSSLLAVALAGFVSEGVLAVLCVPAALLERAAHALDAAGLAPPALGLLPLSMLGGIALLGLGLLRGDRTGYASLCWVLIASAGAGPTVSASRIPGAPRVIFFDVGQGDAALVEGRRARLLIDTGPGPEDGNGGRALLRSLRSLGVSAIDVLALTHADLDHRGGAQRILKELSVAELWLPVSGRGDPSFDALVDLAGRRGSRVQWIESRAAAVGIEDLRVEILWPDERSGRVAAASRNESSLVLRVFLDGVGPDFAVLFAADVGGVVERVLQQTPERIAARVLKVAHHGSRGSSGADFLSAVGAEWAVVSAPCDATRGLPNAGALGRIRRSGAKIAWTGREGAIAIARSPDGDMGVHAWAEPVECDP